MRRPKFVIATLTATVVALASASTLLAADKPKIPGAVKSKVPKQVQALVSGEIDLDDTNNREQVFVEKFTVVTGLEVFVREISAADDCDLVIDCERLVVHSPVKNIKVGDKTHEAGATPRKRIEYPNFDVDVIVNGYEARIDFLSQGVVHEQSYPYTAICGFYQPEGDKVAAQIIANQVALNVDAFFCCINKPDPHRQCVETHIQPKYAAFARVVLQPVRRYAAELRTQRLFNFP